MYFRSSDGVDGRFRPAKAIWFKLRRTAIKGVKTGIGHKKE
jgi:hypothetical protein